MMDFCPFSGSAIFLAAGVVALKNGSQSALIWKQLTRSMQQTLRRRTKRQTLREMPRANWICRKRQSGWRAPG